MPEEHDWTERRNQVERYRILEQETTDPIAARLLHDIVLDLESRVQGIAAKLRPWCRISVDATLPAQKTTPASGFQRLPAPDKLLPFCSSDKRRTFREGVFPKRNIQRAAGLGRGIIEIDAAAPVVANAIRRAIAMFAGEPEVE
jgi:hypothetical protein